MSTRALIARPLDATASTWEGVYLHSDGYPTETGRALYHQVRTHYAGDILGAWCDLIYTHRSGYSSLHPEDRKDNACYCHTYGEGFVAGLKLDTEKHARDFDFTYVLTPTGLAIHRWDHGPVCEIPWDYEGDVPWQEIERAAYTVSEAGYTPSFTFTNPQAPPAPSDPKTAHANTPQEQQ